MTQILEADLTWIDGAFEPGIQVEVTDGGVIGNIGRLGSTQSRRLRRRALVPGMINAHSHAFQRQNQICPEVVAAHLNRQRLLEPLECQIETLRL